ncbi:MAG: HDIG domain-containing metalloprotein [Hoylesella marshii]|uniref:HDIG domain-containing metalloprotein n=1 Tax=Hoylesella marshii TaxID=189722 RepID=UPI003FA10BAE
MVDYQAIINRYYTENTELKHILLVHSRSVADWALCIAAAHPELSVDTTFVEEAAMLHDIGIIRCYAPSIQCFGIQPYICHGREGAEMLRAEGLPRHARVCERHTGAGLSLHDIRSQNLPLPQQDFLPETMEEQLICYADKFFSKTRLDEKKTVEQAERSLAKFGEEGVARFKEWERIFVKIEK